MSSVEINPTVESSTQSIGRSIFARLGRRGPFPLTPAWWDDRLMDWTMKETAVKVQLFRFIDVLPLLKQPADITRHLREYFQEAEESLPGWMRRSLPFMPQHGIAGRLLAGTAAWNAQRLARRFIAGSNLAETLKVVAEQRKRSLAFTVDVLGEATINEAEAIQSQKEYIQLVEGLSKEVNTWPSVPLIDEGPGGPLPRVNVSVKLSSLYSQFDPIDPLGTSRIVRSRLRPVLQAAKASGVFVNLDMEQYSFKDLTIRIFCEILDEPEFRDWPNVGIAIQAYLKDCLEDLRKLRDWAARRGTGVWVRLVKGAYWDYESVISSQLGWPCPVFEEKPQTDANYEACTRFLIENHELLHPAFGSHNIRSLAFALATAHAAGLPKGAYEVQMLYGMADPIKEALVEMGERVRIYTPYGQLLPGMAYLVRRLLENTANESFLRASFVDKVSEEHLLMNPLLEKKAARNGKSPPTQAPGPFENEPFADFSRDETRQKMDQALSAVKSQLGRTFHAVLDRTREVPTLVESVNPSHSKEVVARFSRSPKGLAEEAVTIANRTFPGWRDTPVAKRAECLFKAAAIMRRRRFELSAWELFECAKQRREADADVAEAIDFCEYYGREMLRLEKGQVRNVGGEENFYFYEPRGVAVVIAPWNFPLAILCGMAAAALVSGNTVIMKPAEQSTAVAGLLQEIWQEAGVPAGVMQFLPGIGEEIGPTLTNHKDVAIVAFTGSRPVGLRINHQAAETPPSQDHVKRVIAEMGGKNAIIVDDDADLDEAVLGVVHSAFGYQGQKCSACSRAVVLDKVYDHFLARAIETTRSLKTAPAEDPGCVIGPVIDEEARRRIQQFIGKGKEECKLAYAGELGDLANEGFYVAPHIFADVDPKAIIAQEEIFGPVLAIIRARDLDHALEIANGTRYALTGGLYSRSPERITRIKREFRVGNLYINRRITGALVDRQPFGGFKLSGIGTKAGGPDYLQQFLLTRTITENTLRRGFAPQGAVDYAGGE